MSIFNPLLKYPRRVAGRAVRRLYERNMGAQYAKDGLTSAHSSAFIASERFAKAYAAAKSIGAWHGQDIEWRAHVVAWAAEIATKLEGDFVECGVDFGGTAMVALEYSGIGNTQRKFYLLDTFEGLDDRYISAQERLNGLRSGTYPHGFERVKESFSAFGNVEIIKGSVPETLGRVTSQKVAYLSIDMNCLAPEIAAGEFFWPKLSAGAPIVLDDYGWSAHDEQRKGWDTFARERGLTVLSLPTGQGLIIKPPIGVASISATS